VSPRLVHTPLGLVFSEQLSVAVLPSAQSSLRLGANAPVGILKRSLNANPSQSRLWLCSPLAARTPPAMQHIRDIKYIIRTLRHFVNAG
jgi:hypothetical protein